MNNKFKILLVIMMIINVNNSIDGFNDIYYHQRLFVNASIVLLLCIFVMLFMFNIENIAGCFELKRLSILCLRGKKQCKVPPSDNLLNLIF